MKPSCTTRYTVISSADVLVIENVDPIRVCSFGIALWIRSFMHLHLLPWQTTLFCYLMHLTLLFSLTTLLCYLMHSPLLSLLTTLLCYLMHSPLTTLLCYLMHSPLTTEYHLTLTSLPPPRSPAYSEHSATGVPCQGQCPWHGDAILQGWVGYSQAFCRRGWGWGLVRDGGCFFLYILYLLLQIGKPIRRIEPIFRRPCVFFCDRRNGSFVGYFLCSSFCFIANLGCLAPFSPSTSSARAMHTHTQEHTYTHLHAHEQTHSHTQVSNTSLLIDQDTGSGLMHCLVICLLSVFVSVVCACVHCLSVVCLCL